MWVAPYAELAGDKARNLDFDAAANVWFADFLRTRVSRLRRTL